MESDHGSTDVASHLDRDDGDAESPDATNRIDRLALAKQRTRRRAIVLMPIVALTFLFYFWTGTTEGNPVKFGKQPDAYNQLTDAFLKGHLSLLDRPPAALLALPDPYDPIQNVQFRGPHHDFVLYKGHFFLTWGPTPVVTLLLPWRLLHVGGMPLNLGVILYCWIGFLFSVFLLCFLVDSYLPDTKRWQLGAATTALALCNVAPFLLRRPAPYELAISSAYCFSMIGIYLLASGGLPATRRRWRLIVGSLCIGLATGGRPDLVIEVVLLLALLVVFVRRERGRGRSAVLHEASILIAPFAAVFALVLVYNFARFGSFLENGTTYQLAGVETTKLPMYQLSTIAPNLYYYLFAPVRWTFAFPYFTLPPPPTFPGHTPPLYLTEMTGGLLTTTPIVLACGPAFLVLRRRRERELHAVLLALFGVGMLAVLSLTILLPATTMRYEVDYAAFFVLAGLLGWFVLTAGRHRRVVAVVGAVLIAYGCVAGAAFSIYGYYDELRTTHPGTYWALARLTSPLPTIGAMIVGHPVITRQFAADQLSIGNSGTYDLAKGYLAFSNLPVEVDIVAPGASKSWSLAPTFSRGPGAGTGPLWIAVHAGDAPDRYIPIGSKPTGVPLTLHRGLNRIELRATTSVKETSTQYSGILVSVAGLRLSKA